MLDNFESILDMCIDRINRGDSIEDCLVDYPEYEDELEPLLKSMFSIKGSYSFVPQASAKQAAWQRFSASLRESERAQERSVLPLPWILGKARTWAIAATIVIIALAGYFGITQLLPPGVIPPDETGNFAFYISDEQNAIGDFQSLDLSISKVRLYKEDGGWVEFVPETKEVDLTKLQGDLALQVWRGDIPQGKYTGIFLYVTRASGILGNNNGKVDIVITGNKLHLDMPFEISDAPLTEFVYDMTVIAASGSGYNLQPVKDESGTGNGIKIQKVNGQGQGPGSGQARGSELGQDQGQYQEQQQGQVEVKDQGQYQEQQQGQVEVKDQGQYQEQQQGQVEVKDQGQYQEQQQGQVEVKDQGQYQEQQQEQSIGKHQGKYQEQEQEQGIGEDEGQYQEQVQVSGSGSEQAQGPG
ncbi:DUF4382 domain-containing protein [Chloroflexota bacterium]